MTTDEIFEEYLQQLSSLERKHRHGLKKLRSSEDFKKYCKWREVAYDCKIGKRKMRRIAKD